jgi:hypothetical protein
MNRRWTNFMPTPRFAPRLVGVIMLAFTITIGTPALAKPQDYMVCDNAHAPLYPFVWAHPHGCDLGLGQSIYQAQPVPGRPFVPVGLRHMHWTHWGSYEATAHGIGCNMRSNGSIIASSCVSVEVSVYNAVKIGPAGFTPIYQRVRVVHHRTRARPYYAIAWFRPGTDY